MYASAEVQELMPDCKRLRDAEASGLPIGGSPYFNLLAFTLLLVPLSIAKNREVVAHFDGRERLHEEGRSARGGSVHDARELRTALRLDRHQSNNV